MEAVFEQQTLEFVDTGMGLFLWQTYPAVVSLTEGETYIVEWDGRRHKCLANAANLNGVNGIGLGNLALAGVGANNDMPFLFGTALDGSFSACYTTETDNTNTFAIYRDGIVLKGWNGKDVVHTDLVGVKFLNPAGELVAFTQKEEGGASVEGPYINYTLNDDGDPIAASVHGLTVLPAYCFYNMSKLQAVDLSGSPDLVTIGDYAFYQCTALESVTLCEDSKLTTIGSNAFYKCTSLTSFTIPDGVTTIGYSAFNYAGLTSVVIPDSVTNMRAAFSYCDKLESVVVGNGITEFEAGMFRSCTKLKNVTLGTNLKKIGNLSFGYCSELTSIVIPAAVNYIGYQCFYNATALATVTFMNTSGWFYSSSGTATSGTTVSVSNASTVATYLKSTYVNYYWQRK